MGSEMCIRDSVKGALYRQMGFAHPMQSFMDLIVKIDTNEDKTIVTRISLNKIEDLIPQSKDDGNGDDIS